MFCHVHCFHEGSNFLVINPDECIDCGLCEHECPVEAISLDDDLSNEEEYFLKLNADLSKKWPTISEKKEALEEAEKWKDIKNKLKYLEK